MPFTKFHPLNIQAFVKIVGFWGGRQTERDVYQNGAFIEFFCMIKSFFSNKANSEKYKIYLTVKNSSSSLSVSI